MRFNSGMLSGEKLMERSNLLKTSILNFFQNCQKDGLDTCTILSSEPDHFPLPAEHFGNSLICTDAEPLSYSRVVNIPCFTHSAQCGVSSVISHNFEFELFEVSMDNHVSFPGDVHASDVREVATKVTIFFLSLLG